MNSVKMESGIDIDKIVRSRRKTIALVIERDGSLTVRAPQRASMKSIREFIGEHTRWIIKHQEMMLAHTQEPVKQYVTGESFPYLGKLYPLIITPGQKTKLHFDGSFRLKESARKEGKEVFEKWYRARAREVLTERVRVYAVKHDFQVQKVRISSARTRWGSCSSKGTISLSWRLMLLPMEVVDYVVIHELCHTVVHNHSTRFWKQVEQILPDYRDIRKWLRKNGNAVA